MKRFSNLKIGSKLTLGFAIISIIAVIIGVFGIFFIFQSSRNAEDMYTQNTKPVAALEQVAVYFQRERVNMLRIVMSTTAADQKTYLDRLNGFETTLQQGMKDYGAARGSDKTFKDLTAQLDSYGKVRQQVIDLAMAGKQADAYKYSIDVELNAATAVNNILDQMFKDNVSQAAAINSADANNATLVLIISCALVCVGVIFSVIIGVLTTQSIVRPVKKLISAAESLTVGDVEITIKADSKDELGALMAAFEHLINNIRAQAQVAETIAGGNLTVEVPVRSGKDLLGSKLHEMVTSNNKLLLHIKNAARQVTLGAENIAGSSQSLAQGSTEQASAVEEISATIEEIAGNTRINADTAKEAQTLASKAKTGTDQGNAHVQDMMKSMEDIRASSESISKIISVIDNIAFQTNILALNAAVEAARAGAHGKGFAVVAGEVKNLADKSAKAAKEVTDIILQSTEKVRHGVDTAQTAADALDRISGDIMQVTGLVAKITGASEEQANGLMQVKLAIRQVADVVSTNTALTEESAAASEELSGQAAMLLEMVEEYTLDEDGASLYLSA